MNTLDNNSIFEISSSDVARFRSIVIDTVSEAARLDGSEEYDGIGRLAEKQMHAIIKRFICPDESCHEVRLDNGDGSENTNSEGKKIKKRRFVADVLKGNNVYEIQTGDLAPLREKISWILENTHHTVTVIHPIAETKWVNVISSHGMEIDRRYRSPVKGKLKDVADQLYAIKDFVSSPRFCFVVLMIEAEQYVKEQSKRGRSRKKHAKYELIPTNLLRAHIFRSVSDYEIFISEAPSECFTVKEFSQKTKIRGMAAYSTVHALCDMGLLVECGKIGRATAYKKTSNL